MNTLVKYNPTNDLGELQRMAKMLVASGYFDAKGAIETQIAQMATKILAGAELGFGPFASVNGIHIISGKPSVGANLMASAVKGSSRYDYRVKEMTNDVCSIEFFERDGDKKVSIGISTFTRADGVASGVAFQVSDLEDCAPDGTLQAVIDAGHVADAYALGQADNAAGRYCPPAGIEEHDAYIRGQNDAWAVKNSVNWWRIGEAK